MSSQFKIRMNALQLTICSSVSSLIWGILQGMFFANILNMIFINKISSLVSKSTSFLVLRICIFIVSSFSIFESYSSTCAEVLLYKGIPVSIIKEHQEGFERDYFFDLMIQQDLSGKTAIQAPYIISAYEDLFRRNYVYDINSRGEVTITPYAAYIIQNLESDEIVVYRTMGGDEIRLWKNSQFEELGSVGFSLVEPPEFLIFTALPVKQMNVEQIKLSSSGLSKDFLIKITIKKESLMSLAQSGELRAARANFSVDEIVFTREQLLSLQKIGGIISIEELKD